MSHLLEKPAVETAPTTAKPVLRLAEGSTYVNQSNP